MPQANSAASLSHTKRDKLQIRHSLLESKARASALTDPSKKSRISKENRLKKPRRPNRSLKSTRSLDALAAALPELDQPSKKASKEDGGRGKDDSTKPLDKSRSKPNPATTGLKSKRGIQARKERIAGLEKERFQQNLGIMNTRPGAATSRVGANATAAEDSNINSRSAWWTALRQQIAHSVSNDGG
ncbi:MAG: hypothetical protein M1831_002571 [Alyxoria varia]|nr:MAG: hypothetical protein M1831_002571 [Alyxoria varia]